MLPSRVVQGRGEAGSARHADGGDGAEQGKVAVGLGDAARLGQAQTGLREFALEEKTGAVYLDIAANSHGEEKALLLHRALARVTGPHPHIAEIGPGGGAAISCLAAKLALASKPRPVSMTLIEAPGVESRSLQRAIEQFREIGSCELVRGLAQDLPELLPAPADVISASALLHEVYSYGGGYTGLNDVIRTLVGVLQPSGFFAYRDVYAVSGPSLHAPAVQCCDSPSWLWFLRLWVPHYLRNGKHPYHHADDEIVARQGSKIVPLSELDPGERAFVTGPAGLFREVQRHYITLRDHAWRSGVLGFVPILDGQDAEHWIDRRTGHKRFHYRLNGDGLLCAAQQAMFKAMSEPYADHLTMDSDVLDDITDVSLVRFFGSVAGDGGSRAVWESWLAREGRETYAYLTVEELLTLIATSSAEAGDGTVLLPANPADVFRSPRHYYDRFLSRRLPNPMPDGKQMVLFQHVLLSDSGSLAAALETLEGFCGKRSLARVYAAVTLTGRSWS
jgi:hypothetical protein